MLLGGCCCGAIRYEAVPPFRHETHCYCTLCRGTTGAPVVTWFTARRDRFRLTAGAATEYRSTATGTRGFCGRCGTQIFFRNDTLPGEIDVTACSLDQPERITPRDHVWTRSRPGWLRSGDGLPEYPEARTAPS